MIVPVTAGQPAFSLIYGFYWCWRTCKKASSIHWEISTLCVVVKIRVFCWICFSNSVQWYACTWTFYAFSTEHCWRRHNVFGLLSAAFARLFIRTFLLPRYLMNSLCILDETYRGYSLAATDDLLRSWRSKIPGQGDIRPCSWSRHPRLCWGVKAHLLVEFRFRFYFCLFRFSI